MKILKYTTLACALLLSSCTKSFLEVESIGNLGTEQLFKDANGMHDALMGSYNLAAKFFQSDYTIYGDLRADNVIRINNAGITLFLNEYNYQYDQESAGATLSLWGNGYAVVNNINNIINSAEAIRASSASDSNVIDAIVAQAHVLRGLMFFALSNVYAQHYTYTADASHLGIPLPLSTPSAGTKIARATIKGTYSQIIADLKFAIDTRWTNQNPRIYASADAAKALLSRIYLYMGDYDNAIFYANEILNTVKYPLTTADKYVDMYLGLSQRTDFNSIDKEVIWQFSLTTRSTNFIDNFFGGVEYLGTVSADFLNAFDNDDVRLRMYPYSDKTKDYRIIKNAKYENVIDANAPVTFKIIRSAELYLNRAEAYYHKKQYDLAAADLKVIRARAYNTAIDATIVSYTSPDDLWLQIKEERRKELGFEGQRIFDIMRYKESLKRGGDCNSPVCTVSYPNDIFILPIPKAELDANELIKPNPTVNN